MSRRALGITKPPVQQVPAYSPGAQLTDREVDRSSLFTREVKNEWILGRRW